MTVANRIPKASEVAIGITSCACMLVSRMIGTRPKNVDSEVSRMALKRLDAASLTAYNKGTPRARSLLTKSTRIRLSFTTTPASAIMPKKLIMLT